MSTSLSAISPISSTGRAAHKLFMQVDSLLIRRPLINSTAGPMVPGSDAPISWIRERVPHNGSDCQTA